MAEQRIFDANGQVIRTIVVENPNDIHSITGFVTRQDCQPIVDYVAQQRHTVERGPGINGRVLAQVPVSIAEAWFRDGSLHDQEFIKRWLRDPDNRAFRVDEKSI